MDTFTLFILFFVSIWLIIKGRKSNSYSGRADYERESIARLEAHKQEKIKEIENLPHVATNIEELNKLKAMQEELMHRPQIIERHLHITVEGETRSKKV